MATHIISRKLIEVIKNLSLKKKIPLHEPFFDKSDKAYLNKCINSSFVSTVSKFTNIFESEICKLSKARYAVATINGTSALEISIKALNISKNSEILIPNLNYIASSNAVLYNNCIPHFVDADINNLGIDYEKLDKYLEKNFIKEKFLINKKTKRKVEAIIPTHIFGYSSDIGKLLKLKKKYNLKIIEDASECVGSFYKGKHLGTFGDIGVLSFNGNKIITTGGGGAIISNNKNIYKKAFSLCTISTKKKNNWTYDYSALGFNYRMPGLNACIGISQIKKIRFLLKKKERLFQYYNNKFRKEKLFKLIHPIKNSSSNFWLNAIYIYDSNIKLRNRIIKEINKKEISVRPVWKLMKKIKYLSEFPCMDLKNSIYLEKRLINLPSSSNLLKN